MTINVEVLKTPNENNINVLRRFTKKVQNSGILPKVRSKRYSERNKSEYVKKKKTLKTLTRKKEIEELIRQGKMKDLTRIKK